MDKSRLVLSEVNMINPVSKQRLLLKGWQIRSVWRYEFLERALYSLVALAGLSLLGFSISFWIALTLQVL